MMYYSTYYIGVEQSFESGVLRRRQDTFVVILISLRVSASTRKYD